MTWVISIIEFAVLLFTYVLLAHSAGNEPIIPLPDSNKSTFRTDSRNSWQNEVPSVLGRYFPVGFVVSGGIHGTSPTCLSSAFATEAFTNAAVTTKQQDHVGALANGPPYGSTVAINYATQGVGGCTAGTTMVRVAICSVSGNTIAPNWNRVVGSNYFTEHIDTAPVVPAGCAGLMDVTITNGAIATIANISNSGPTVAAPMMPVVPPDRNPSFDTIKLRDTSAAFDDIVSGTSLAPLTANRQLTLDLGNADRVLGAVLAEVISTDYNFRAQLPGGILVSGANTITLSPCPRGVNGTNTGHYLYISGGVGVAEPVLITGGTCTSGATTGTVVFSVLNGHSGLWTVVSATAGIVEALYSTGSPGNVVIPRGTHSIYAKIVVPYASTIRGAGIRITVLSVTGFTTRAVEVIAPPPPRSFVMADLTISYAVDGTAEEGIYLQEVTDGSVDNVGIIHPFNGVNGVGIGRVEFKSMAIFALNDCFKFSSNPSSIIIPIAVPNIIGGRCNMTGSVGAVLRFGSIIAGMTITGLQSAAGANAVAVDDVTNGVINEVTISNCIFDSLAGSIVNIQLATNTVMSRWAFNGNMLSTTSSATNGVIVKTTTPGNIRGFTFNGNKVTVNNASANALNLQGIQGASISNNVINNGVAGGKAILLDGSANSNMVITGNVTGDSLYIDTAPFGVGLFINSQAHNNIRVGVNHFKGTSTDVSNSSTGTVYLGNTRPVGSAGGKKVVCIDTATGHLYASSTGTDCTN